MVVDLKWFRITIEFEKLPGIHVKCPKCNKYTNTICLEGYEECKCGWEEADDILDFDEFGHESDEICPKCGEQKLFKNQYGDVWCNYPCDYAVYVNREN